MEFEHSDVLIVRSKRGRNGYHIRFLVGTTPFEAFSPFPIAEGSFGTLKGLLTPQGMVVKEAQLEPMAGEELALLKEKIEKSIALEEVEPLAPMPPEMWEALKGVARKLKVAELLSSFNVMRYHGDADGISAAFQLSFLPALKFQQNGPHYTARDALTDVQNAQHAPAKLLLLLDFVGEEEEGLEIAKAGGFDVVVLDHHEHKPHEGVLEVNPWHYGLDSSYTAGYLAYEVARLLGKGQEEWLGPSLAGDKSELFPYTKEDRERALVMDFLATTSSSSSLDFYRKTLSDQALFKTILMQAEDSMLELKQIIVRMVKKRQVGNATVYLLNTDAVKRRRDFPSRAKLTTLLFEMVKDKEALAIGYSSRVVTFRLSPSLAEKGVDVRRIIEDIKAKYSDIVVSGGGHPRAGSVIFLEGYKDLVVEEALKALARAVGS